MTKKTKYMVVIRKEFRNYQSVKMGAYTLEIIKKFKYLSTFLTQKNELKYKIEVTTPSSFKMSNDIQECKIRMCKTLIKPILTYGSEGWSLNLYTAKRLASVERKILRRIFRAQINTFLLTLW